MRYDSHNGQSNYQLVKYNLETLETQVLVEDASSIGGHVSWGRNGWIVFMGISGPVWKIKDNGDSLGTIPNTGIFYFEGLDYSGDRGIFTTGDYDLFHGSVIITLEGEIEDTIGYYGADDFYYGFYELAPIDEDRIAFIEGFGDNRHLSVFDLNTEEVSRIKPIGAEIINTIWLSASGSNIYLSAYSQALLSINSVSGETSILKNQCGTRKYQHISVSPDGQRIVAQREDWYRIDGSCPYFDTYLVVMDASGCNERALDLP